MQFYHMNSINSYSVYLKAVEFLVGQSPFAWIIERITPPLKAKHGTNEVSTALPLDAMGTEVHNGMLWQFSCVLLSPACEV